MADGKLEKYIVDGREQNRGGTASRTFFRIPWNEEYRPMYPKKKMVKHGGSSIMIWACFSYYEVGPIVWIKTIMDQHIYVDILPNVMLPCRGRNAVYMGLPAGQWPKYTSKKAKKWFAVILSTLWNGLHSLGISIQLRICGLTSKRQFTPAIQHLMKLFG